MNLLVSRRGELYIYGSVLFISLAMAAAILFYIPSHCEQVAALTGITGACGLGAGWIVFLAGFLAIAVYAAYQIRNIRAG